MLNVPDRMCTDVVKNVKLTFVHHWGFGHCGGVGLSDVAGEVGLAVGQVSKQQATVVAWEDASSGTFFEGGVLLLIWVGGVEESMALCVLTKGFWWLTGERIFAIHAEVVLVYRAVAQPCYPLGWCEAYVQCDTKMTRHSPDLLNT